nr:reverse transcriptase domain-containing protein [Tanacetum cinerariifolium]
MSRPEAAGRLQKWSIMLGEHNITYRPRTSIKGQILADFLNEIPSNASQGASVAETQEEPWTLFTDGSSCVDGLGAGLILTNPYEVEFTYALRFQFAASNNEAEYEALIDGLRIATQIGEDNMIKYLEIAKVLVSGFKTFSISQVPRSKNKKADALSKIASTSFTHLSKQVLVEVLETKSITGKEVTAVIEEEGPTWMTELVNYLKEGTLPEDEKEARKIRLKAHQYELIEGILYKRSFLTPWLRCVGPLQAEYVMKEIHEGSCSMHAGSRPRFDPCFDEQEICIADSWFELISVVHMMAMLTLMEAHSKLIPDQPVSSKLVDSVESTDNIRSVVDLLVKAARYLQFYLREILVQIPPHIKLKNTKKKTKSDQNRTKTGSVKENQEKDKIGSKPDKNEKRVEAGKSLKQFQWIKEEKPKKTQKEWSKTHTRLKNTKKKTKSDQNRTKTGSVAKPGKVRSSYSI